MIEHWMDKALTEKRPINMEGNYIRIPAEAFVKMQEFKNRHSKKKLSLYEANLAYENGE